MLKKTSKRVAAAFASLAKHDLIPQAKYQHPKRLLKEALTFYEVDLIIDVGANRGQFAREMLDAGFKGRILSFEPTLQTFQHLERLAFNHSNWDCLRLALGEQEGELTLNRHGDDSLNSFLKTNALAQLRYKGLDSATEKVPVERLDGVIARLVTEGRLSQNFRAFLKLDTQGFDLKVLSGAAGMLDRVFVLQSEASVNPIYEGMPDYKETLAAVDALGFKPAAFATVSRDSRSLQFVEFDIIALKSNERAITADAA